MAAAMPRGIRILHSCRGFAMRPTPVCSRPRALPQLARTYRFQSNDTSNQTPSATETSVAGETGFNTEVIPFGVRHSVDVIVREPKADCVGHQAPIANPLDSIDDAELEKMMYGGRSAQQGGLSEAQEEVLYRDGAIPPAKDAETVLAAGEDIQNLGHKWPLPQKPYPDGFNVKKRYHPVVEQITRLMMRDGKLAAAQRNLAMTMNFLRMAPEPTFSPKFPLLPGTPPASHLSLNPVLYLTVAIDSVAPLIRGSGRTQFAHRLADEIIAVVEGRSSVWEKRKLIHKQGTTARANVEKRVMIKKSAGK
ncbi:hypothetical protein LLEC1_02875 [Akanthomyces lecanii]|uniref:Ribosomal protein S7 domain-containing protein n=1 Tax=Cordyceps confragosa TaxID=2714763 RepID=A0A179I8Q0_CORDF|nr:hypothetical protein LLEC1_02875 [Akanthomyces lecanii]